MVTRRVVPTRLGSTTGPLIWLGWIYPIGGQNRPLPADLPILIHDLVPQFNFQNLLFFFLSTGFNIRIVQYS
jgi:hypothetical protein